MELDAQGVPWELPERAALLRALLIDGICRRYPAYTPETVLRADVSLLRHLQYVAAASAFGQRAEQPGAAGELGW